MADDKDSARQSVTFNSELNDKEEINPNLGPPKDERVELTKGKDHFEKCARIGKIFIDNVKASLLASSADFSRSNRLTTIEDPYAKAYRYLEKNQVLAMLEELITQTVYNRPRKPFPFMSEVVEHYYKDGLKETRES